MPDAALPLARFRVLDLTRVRSGPTCVKVFADWGADVIKIEAPPELADGDGYTGDRSSSDFQNLHRNKRSLTLNLKADDGRAIFMKLVERADVIVENYRPDVKNRLGIDYESARKVNPRIVYGSISGFGQTGPDAMKPAYDQIIQGLSGVMAINGDERLNPLRAGFPVCDTVGGLNAAFAIMAALYHRERTGEGQFIDVAMLDSIMPLMGWVAANLLIGGQQPVLMGNDNFTAAPSGTFKTADGYVNIAGPAGRLLRAFCDAIGRPALPADRDWPGAAVLKDAWKWQWPSAPIPR